MSESDRISTIQVMYQLYQEYIKFDQKVWEIPGSRWTDRQQNYKIMDGRKDADNTKIISLGLYQTEYNVDTDHMTRN